MAEDYCEPARQGPQDRRSLLQRALACELTGRLDCALALIHRLRAADPIGVDPPSLQALLTARWRGAVDQASCGDRRIA